MTGLASAGDGVGRLPDGRVVFIEGAAVGDVVTLSGLQLKGKVARARIAALVEASPDRVEPRCAHFGECGGCRWQHLSYAAQLRAKQQILQDALVRIGGFDFDALPDIVASPSQYGYRARARLVQVGDRLGYRRLGSHEGVAATECPILVPAAETELAKGVPQAADATRKRRGKRDVEWEILVGSDPDAPPLVEVAAPTREPRRGAGRAGRAKGRRPAASLGPRRAASPGGRSDSPEAAAARASIRVLGETLEARLGSFVQGNALLWEALAAAVRDACLFPQANAENPAAPDSARRFVELYAGIGFLTLPLARAGFSGAAFESSPSAVRDLEQNLEAAGLSDRVEAVCGDVGVRGDWAARFRNADVLLADPPRTGLAEPVREAIASEGPPRLVMVSCDPATLARDLRGLAASGYEIMSLRAFDLFPQTPHVEAVVQLERGARAR